MAEDFCAKFREGYTMQDKSHSYIYVCTSNDMEDLPVKTSIDSGYISIADRAAIWEAIPDFVFIPGIRVAGRRQNVFSLLKYIVPKNTAMLIMQSEITVSDMAIKRRRNCSKHNYKWYSPIFDGDKIVALCTYQDASASRRLAYEIERFSCGKRKRRIV